MLKTSPEILYGSINFLIDASYEFEILGILNV
jgi:hypothetical protein